MTEKISLIVPLRLTAGTHEGELRLRRLVAAVPGDLFEIVISDYGTDEAHAGPIRELEAQGVRVVRHPAPGKLFSIGQARDFGVQMARGDVILFNDIDFLGTPQMYRAIHAEAKRRNLAGNLFDFFCVPVLFLTEEGTRAWFAAVEKGEPLVEPLDVEMLEKSDTLVQFTAYGSSAMVVNRHHYLSLGGHDRKFSGHGAEDYDILHRLAALAPLGPRPHDYLTDFKDNGVRSYWGFRAFFALYGLDVFARGIHLVHLWHPRRMEKGYFRARPNFRHLKKLMRRFDARGAMPMPLADPARNDRWLVAYRTQEDLALIRQLLPFSGDYELARLRTLPPASTLVAMARAEDARTIIVAPGVSGEIDAAEPLAGMTLLRLRTAGAPDAFEFSLRRDAGAAETVIVQSRSIRSAGGRVVYRHFDPIEIGGLVALRSGEIPACAPLSSPLFATFGGEGAIDKSAHPRPVTRKKSTLWVKLRRRLSGY